MTKELSKPSAKVFNAIKQHLSQFTGENAGYSDLYAADLAKKLKMKDDEVTSALEELSKHELIVDGAEAYGAEYAGIIYLKTTEEEPAKKEEPKNNKANNTNKKENAMTPKKEDTKPTKTAPKKEEQKKEDTKPTKPVIGKGAKKEEPKKEEPKTAKPAIGAKGKPAKKGGKKQMMLIKKADLAKKLQESFEGPNDLFQNIIGKLVDGIKEELMNGNQVKIAGLGTFKVRILQPRTVWNPIKGESHDVGASARVVFKVEKGLKQYFNESQTK